MSKYHLVSLSKISLVFSLMFLSACTARPNLHLKDSGMTAEIEQEIPKVLRVAVSRDGKYILSGSLDSTFRLWDLSSGKELRKFTVNPKSFNYGKGIQVAFSPDNKHAISAGADNLKVWDIATGNEVKSFDLSSGNASDISISADGRYVLLAIRSMFLGEVSLLDLDTGKFSQFERSGAYYSIALSPSVKYGLAGDFSGKMTIWNVPTGRPIREVNASAGGNLLLKPIVQAVTFSPDGKYALSGGVDNTLRLWTIPGLAEIKKLTGHTVSFRAAAPYPLGVMSVAFSPDGKYALSGGGDNIIKMWDLSTGAELKEFTGHSGIEGVTSVKFTPDGKRIVSAGDASTRVWDVATGEEVATMIGFEDGEWIVTTPKGYYNASAKGDQYLKVKVGGQDYATEQLRETFYRPDLVKMALSGGSLKEFKNIADIKQPPVVSIVNTPSNTDKNEISVTLKIADSGGGIGDIRLYLNGSAVVLDNSRGLAITPKSDGSISKTYSVRLTNGLNSIRAIAFNADNTMQSTDAIHQITASFKSTVKPSIYAIVIGINEYKNPRLTLNFAVADAGLFGDSLQAGASGIFDKVVIKRLVTKEETTSANIMATLKKMQTLNPDDLFVFYVASHGAVDDGEYFLITSNVGSTSTAKLKTDAINQATLKGLIANIPTAKKLIVIDTCNAGALGDAIQTAMLTRGMSEDTAMKVLSRAVGSTILSASSGVQEALEGYNGHGLFTYVLSQGLSGKADYDKDGYIKTTELANYIDDEVPALAERIYKKAQYPTVAPSGQAFPIGRVQ